MNRLSLLFILLFATSCSLEYDPIIPVFSDAESILTGVDRLDTAHGALLSGVYRVRLGRAEFGDSIVLRWTRLGPSIFCERNGAFMIMSAGHRGDTLVMEGYWRYAYGRETGRIRCLILPDDGGSSIARGQRPDSIVLRGHFGGISGLLDKPIEVAFARPLRPRTRPFYVVGHRGGGRNSDLHPVSENSLPMVRFSERLGCNSVEIDVRLTADRIPILFHDETMSNRLVLGDHLVGPVSAYTWAQLRRYARLLNGEQIPLFDAVLDAIVEETGLELVWLDVKSPDVIDVIVPIVDKYRKRAAQRGRTLQFLVGLPDDDLYNKYNSLSVADRPSALCELDPGKTTAIQAAAWGPRWTLGIQTAEVARMHAEGRIVISWTIDAREILLEFLRNGEFDGIVTNYPTVVYAMSELHGK